MPETAGMDICDCIEAQPHERGSRAECRYAVAWGELKANAASHERTVASLRERVGRLEAALIAVESGSGEQRCWCSVAMRAGHHQLRCRRARAALAEGGA